MRSDIGMNCGKIAAQCLHAMVPVSIRVILRATTEEFEQVQTKVRSKGGATAVVIRDPELASAATALSLVGEETLVDGFTGHLRAL